VSGGGLCGEGVEMFERCRKAKVLRDDREIGDVVERMELP